MNATFAEEDARVLNDWAKNGGIPIPPPGVFVLPGGAVTISDSARHLYEVIAPRREVFARGKAIVTLQRDDDGTLVLQPLSPSAARSLFEKYVEIWAWRVLRGEPVLKRATMPEDTARVLLNCYLASEILPAINGLVNCPILTEGSEGLRIIGKGYDADTGLLVVDGEPPTDVPLSEAVNSLKELLENYDFLTDGDASRAIAAFVAPALKMGSLLGGYVPVDVAEANESQSGKTYRQRMCSAIYAERSALVTLKKGGVGSIDESFSQRLVNGRPFIQFDNFRGAFDSPALESFMTAENSYYCRVPHFGDIRVDPSRFFVQLSSNGVEITRDFANRSSIVRIVKREGFSFPDTLQIIRAKQSYYLGCVFAVVTEWFRRGKPRTNEMRHDFREWCGTLDWIVQNLFGMVPLMDGHTEAQVRVSNPTLTFLRQIALEVERQCRLGEEMSASQLVDVAETGAISIPGIREQNAGDSDKAMKMVGMKLAPIFQSSATVAVEGFTVERIETLRERTDGNGSFPSKSYRFIRVAQ